MGIEELLTAPRSPWQNPYVERLIGSIRRGCLNQFVILNTKHLKRALASFSVTTMVSGPMWGWTSNIHSLGRSRVSGGSSAPLYRFHRWQTNLRVLEVAEIKAALRPTCAPVRRAADRHNSARVLGSDPILGHGRS